MEIVANEEIQLIRAKFHHTDFADTSPVTKVGKLSPTCVQLASEKSMQRNLALITLHPGIPYYSINIIGSSDKLSL